MLKLEDMPRLADEYRAFMLDRIAQAAHFANALHHERFWIENDAEGFTGWRWDKYNVQRRIVCAANRYKDYILLGPRHWSDMMYMASSVVDQDLLHEYAGELYEEQGFIDQFGNYLTREEAWVIAMAAGQVIHDIGPTGTLFSEHLY